MSDIGPEVERVRLERELEEARDVIAEHAGNIEELDAARLAAEAAAEEARQAHARVWKELTETQQKWHDTAADLAEARQERERFEALALTNAKAADRNAARIQTLEAALRAVTIQTPSGQWCLRTENDVPMGMSRRKERLVAAALQPTPTQEGDAENL